MHLNLSKWKQNQIISGTLCLTLSGVFCKSMGFFYRIFLSRTIGAEGLGIYQLVLPILALLLAICSTGLSTSLSRCVSYDSKKASNYLVIGLFVCSVLSLVFGLLLYFASDYLSLHLLGESQTAPLLRMVAITILPCAWHNCISGYCYGRKKATVPALSQFLEQFVRIALMLLLYQYTQWKNLEFGVGFLGIGLLFGEIAGFVTSYHVFHKAKKPRLLRIPREQYHTFFHIALPLSINQLLLNLFSSLEFLLIPQMLVLYGYSHSDALQVFGVFTGMALSFVFAPSVLINALAVMLLPEVAEASSQCNHRYILSMIHKVLWFGMIFGILCGLLFFQSRFLIANIIFKNALVESYLARLCFLCPLIYIEALLHSILAGQCFSRELLIINLTSCTIRILSILFGIPRFGMNIYILGLIVSSGTNILLCLAILQKDNPKNF